MARHNALLTPRVSYLETVLSCYHQCFHDMVSEEKRRRKMQTQRTEDLEKQRAAAPIRFSQDSVPSGTIKPALSVLQPQDSPAKNSEAANAEG